MKVEFNNYWKRGSEINGNKWLSIQTFECGWGDHKESRKSIELCLCNLSIELVWYSAWSNHRFFKSHITGVNT